MPAAPLPNAPLFKVSPSQDMSAWLLSKFVKSISTVTAAKSTSSRASPSTARIGRDGHSPGDRNVFRLIGMDIAAPHGTPAHRRGSRPRAVYRRGDSPVGLAGQVRPENRVARGRTTNGRTRGVVVSEDSSPYPPFVEFRREDISRAIDRYKSKLASGALREFVGGLNRVRGHHPHIATTTAATATGNEQQRAYRELPCVSFPRFPADGIRCEI